MDLSTTLLPPPTPPPSSGTNPNINPKFGWGIPIPTFGHSSPTAGQVNPNPNPTPSLISDEDEDQAEGGNVLPLHSAEVNNSIPESGETRRRIRIRGGKQNPSFRLTRVASVFFAALVVYFFWKYAPSTPELEEGELEDSDEDENNMFFFQSTQRKLSFHAFGL